jgi:hypothetical protein
MSASSAAASDFRSPSSRQIRAGKHLRTALLAALMASSCFSSIHAADVDIVADTSVGINLDDFAPGSTAEVFSGVTVSNDINGTLIGANYSAISASTERMDADQPRHNFDSEYRRQRPGRPLFGGRDSQQSRAHRGADQQRR